MVFLFGMALITAGVTIVVNIFGWVVFNLFTPRGRYFVSETKKFFAQMLVLALTLIVAGISVL